MVENGQESMVDAGLDTGLNMPARFRNVVASPEQLAHEFAQDGRAFGRTELPLTAKKLGLESKSACSSLECLAHMPLPAMAAGRDGYLFIIARLDEVKGQVLIHDSQA